MHKKLIQRETDEHGRSILTVEVSMSIFGIEVMRKENKFLAGSAIIEGKYWGWLRLPGYTLVEDGLSFQLDAWERESQYVGRTSNQGKVQGEVNGLPRTDQRNK
jgi:hypothetical protein